MVLAWDTTSKAKQRQQIVHFSFGSPLRDQSNGNKLYIFVTTSRPKQRQHIVHLSIGAPLRDQSNGNKSYILELGYRFEVKATVTNRKS